MPKLFPYARADLSDVNTGRDLQEPTSEVATQASWTGSENDYYHGSSSA